MKPFILFAFRVSLTWGLGLAISMLVLLILVLWIKAFPRPPIGETVYTVEELAEQIELFHSQTHQYPKRYEEFIEIFYEKKEQAPADKPEKYDGSYLLLPVTDPWGREYRYQVPGLHRKKSFDLFSLGQDGQPETKDDINNWDKNFSSPENYSRLENAYRPSFVRRFLDDFPPRGVLVFWLIVILLSEVMSILLHKSSLSLWRQILSSTSPTEDWMRFCALIISALFLFVNSQLFLNNQLPAIYKQISVDINSIQIKMHDFKSKIGRYPHTYEEVLKAFSSPEGSPSSDWGERTTKDSYLLLPISDPWGRSYRYRSPGLHHPEFFDLWSLGQDGQLETLDDVKDWDESWRKYSGPVRQLRQFFYDNPLLGLTAFWLGVAFLLKCLEWFLYGRTKTMDED